MKSKLLDIGLLLEEILFYPLMGHPALCGVD